MEWKITRLYDGIQIMRGHNLIITFALRVFKGIFLHLRRHSYLHKQINLNHTHICAI